jgi:hypothetical protein
MSPRRFSLSEQCSESVRLTAVPESRALVQAALADQSSGRTLASEDLALDLFPTSHPDVYVQHVFQVSERRTVNFYWFVCGGHRCALGGFMTQRDAERAVCPECEGHNLARTGGWKRGYQRFLSLRLQAASR